MPKAVERKPIFVLIIPQFKDLLQSFFAGEITKGVNLAASRLNVDILVHFTDRQDHSTWLDPSLLDRQFVDGILWADIDRDTEMVKAAVKKGMSCLVLNNILDEPINFIAVDNHKAAVEAVGQLISLGHTRIATITGDLSTQAGYARLEGFKDALAKHGLSVPKEFIQNGNFLRSMARKAAEDLLSLSPKKRPTAIFAASDVMALEVIDVARQKKLDIPRDLSVIGFDGNPIIHSSSIKLATVEQPLVEMGRLGLERLFLISRGKAKLPVKEILQAKIVQGQSMGAI